MTISIYNESMNTKEQNTRFIEMVTRRAEIARKNNVVGIIQMSIKMVTGQGNYVVPSHPLQAMDRAALEYGVTLTETEQNKILEILEFVLDK